MAEGAISSLLAPLIQPLILDNFKLLSGVRSEIDHIRCEFEHMIAFLQVAGAHEDDDNPQFEVWVKQVRDTAYDADDIIEQFILRLGNRRSVFYKTYGFMKTITVRHQIASEVERIKSKLRVISECKQRYQHYNVEASSSNNVPTYTRRDTRRHDDPLLLRENELVGITKHKSELIKLLVDEKNHKLQVVSVRGMGGLGKTTVVKKVFDDTDIVNHFKVHAWITVSKSFEIKELLKGLIKKLFDESKKQVPVAVEQMDQNGLKTFISGFLQNKRYVIVLDDVWTESDWDKLKYAFPNNNFSSRVILTTREASIGNVYSLSPLSEEESLTLFCKKAFQGESCPQGLEEITKKILKKCGGLPLAVVAIGGLLATKVQSIDEWVKIYRGLGAELVKEGKLENVDKVLSLSYFDLPWYIKPCFLYLSIFPEDWLIDPSLVIRLWIAEGFVQSKQGLTPEEVADDYLTELLNRSLILVATRGYDGRAKQYQVHDIWRELILSRSRKQDLVTTFGAQQSSSHKVRRLSIHNETGDWQDIKDRATHIRSLLMFGSRDSEFTTPIMDSLGNGERLVKVLHLGNSGLTTFPSQIGKLLHLKYLSLRDNFNIEEVPKSIGDLQMLETLDLKYTNVRELPNEILKLSRLRYLLVTTDMDVDDIYGFKALKGIEKLSCLQELDSIDLNVSESNVIVRNLGELTKLRKIDISPLKSRDAKELCMTLEKLTELRSLSITAIEDDDEIIDLEPLSSPPKYLQTLDIVGRMEKLPQWIHSLQNLTTLELDLTKLKEDPLLQLQDLPNLTSLCLQYDAYEGEALTFQAATFKKLTYLKLWNLKGLKRVSVMEGAMPRLKRLHFHGCRLMEELPSGIETLRCLTHLSLFYMSDELISKVNREEQNDNSLKIAHIPNVRILGSRNDGEYYKYNL